MKVSIEVLGKYSISVIYSVEDENGNYIEYGREGLTPNKLSRAKEILPIELYARVSELWNDEVISEYTKMIEEHESVFPYVQPTTTNPPDSNSNDEIKDLKDRIATLEQALNTVLGGTA